MSIYFHRNELVARLLHLSSQYPLVFLTGPHGAGKTNLLQEIGRRRAVPVVRIEPIAATPERLLHAIQQITSGSLGQVDASLQPYEGLLDAVQSRPAGELLLLDDLTELRCLSYFPGVTKPFERFIEALLNSGAPTIATTRFSHWLSHRKNSPVQPPRARLLPVPPIDRAEISNMGVIDADRIAYLSGGIVLHAAILSSHLMENRTLEDALVHELSVGSRLETECRASITELLHRARGYGTCKAVLQILAEKEPLTLTQVSKHLNRTPGSTRDYLRWLEEVDLIHAVKRRYQFVDPMVRIWLRLYADGRMLVADRLDQEVKCLLEKMPLPNEPTLRRDDLLEID